MKFKSVSFIIYEDFGWRILPDVITEINLNYYVNIVKLYRYTVINVLQGLRTLQRGNLIVAKRRDSATQRIL